MQRITRFGRAASVRMTGPAYRSDHNITVIAIGPDRFIDHVGHLLFDRKPEIIRLQAWPFSIFEQAHSSTADIIASVPWPWVRASRRELRIRLALDATLPIATSAEDYVRKHLSKSQRQDLQRRTQYPLTYSVSQNPTDLCFWYEKLFVPLAQIRHGKNAYIPPFSEMLKLGTRSELLLIHLESEIIAGSLLEYAPAKATQMWVGMREQITQDNKLYKALNMALDYYGLERACARGTERYSLGYTLSRVDAGQFQYKRRWGAAFEPDPNSQDCILRFTSSRYLNLLEAVPLIAQHKQQLRVHTAVTSTSETALDELKHRIAISEFNGLEKTVVHVGTRHLGVVAEYIKRAGLKQILLSPDSLS